MSRTQALTSMQKGAYGTEPAAEVADEPDAETPHRKAKIKPEPSAALIEDMAPDEVAISGLFRSRRRSAAEWRRPSHKAAIKHKHARRGASHVAHAALCGAQPIGPRPRRPFSA